MSKLHRGQMRRGLLSHGWATLGIVGRGRWYQLACFGSLAFLTSGCGLLFPLLHDDYIEPVNEPSDTVIVPNAQASAEAAAIDRIPDWSAFQRLTIRRNQVTLKTEGDVPPSADIDAFGGQ